MQFLMGTGDQIIRQYLRGCNVWFWGNKVGVLASPIGCTSFWPPSRGAVGSFTWASQFFVEQLS